jgi:hypothetical protein
LKELRPYQKDISWEAKRKLDELGIVYLSMQVRTGKTATAIQTAINYGARRVLFLTKKKAISSIESDLKEFGFMDYFKRFDILNDESLHKVEHEYDLVIHDEHHRFGAFPKPNVTAKLFKEKFSHLPMIFLSGTPHPESYSQIFHQFYVSKRSPFNYKNFYGWAKEFVNVKDRHLGYAVVKDYSEANYDKLKPIIDKYFITYTQEDAGFVTEVIEKVLYCEMKPTTHALIKQLVRDRFIQGKNEEIIADTGVKLQQKLHQMYSGTVIFESGNFKVLDTSKAEFIHQFFSGKKIGIFYKFKAELEALKQVFRSDLTTDLEEFNTSNKSIALQIVSGREGISLKEAEYLVFYNIDFSAISYFQAKDRLTTMERKSNEVFWIFSKGGIEEKIYISVMNKKDYTNQVFKKDYGISIPK